MTYRAPVCPEAEKDAFCKTQGSTFKIPTGFEPEKEKPEKDAVFYLHQIIQVDDANANSEQLTAWVKNALKEEKGKGKNFVEVVNFLTKEFIEGTEDNLENDADFNFHWNNRLLLSKLISTACDLINEKEEFHSEPILNDLESSSESIKKYLTPGALGRLETVLSVRSLNSFLKNFLGDNKMIFIERNDIEGRKKDKETAKLYLKAIDTPIVKNLLVDLCKKKEKVEAFLQNAGLKINPTILLSGYTDQNAHEKGSSGSFLTYHLSPMEKLYGKDYVLSGDKDELKTLIAMNEINVSSFGEALGGLLNELWEIQFVYDYIENYLAKEGNKLGAIAKGKEFAVLLVERAKLMMATPAVQIGTVKMISPIVSMGFSEFDNFEKITSMLKNGAKATEKRDGINEVISQLENSNEYMNFYIRDFLRDQQLFLTANPSFNTLFTVPRQEDLDFITEYLNKIWREQMSYFIDEKILEKIKLNWTFPDPDALDEDLRRIYEQMPLERLPSEFINMSFQKAE